MSVSLEMLCSPEVTDALSILYMFVGSFQVLHIVVQKHAGLG